MGYSQEHPLDATAMRMKASDLWIKNDIWAHWFIPYVFGTFTMDAFVCALGIIMRNENHYVQLAPDYS